MLPISAKDEKATSLISRQLGVNGERLSYLLGLALCLTRTLILLINSADCSGRMWVRELVLNGIHVQFSFVQVVLVFGQEAQKRNDHYQNTTSLINK